MLYHTLDPILQPQWYDWYPIALKNPKDYFAFTGDTAGLFSWDTKAAEGLSDPDGISDMTADEVLVALAAE